VLDSHARFADFNWQSRFLSAGMAYFKAPARKPVPVVQEAMELLQE